MDTINQTTSDSTTDLDFTIDTASPIFLNRASLLEQALYLAKECGFYVFPCRIDKKPYTLHGYLDGTNNPREIEKYWSDYPNALIGIACEKSGIFVLDVDKKGEVNGFQTLADLIDVYGDGEALLPKVSSAQKTPNGGHHYLFKYPRNFEVPNNAGVLGAGLDLRSKGYICTGGKGYQWLFGYEPQKELTDAPEWLLNIIKSPPKKALDTLKTILLETSGSITLTRGELWLRKALKQATRGTRNDTGLWLGCQLRDAGLTYIEAEVYMIDYANSLGNGYTEGEALTTLGQVYKRPPRDKAVSQNTSKTDYDTSKMKDKEIFDLVNTSLAKLKKERAENYEEWIEVGLCLHKALGDSGLAVWDTWSKSSLKYVPGNCAQKWLTFFDNDECDINKLIFLAQEDSKDVFIPPCPKKAKPSHYMSAVHLMGFYFTMNEMNDRIYVNGTLLSDGMKSYLVTQLKEYGYNDEKTALDAWVSEAFEHRFHPIREYLNGLKWDGKDHISEVGKYIKDKDGIFPLLLHKWMVGAVGKIIGGASIDEQNPMIVMDGPQGMGKSRFAWWLGSVLPEYYKVGAIYPENKDHQIDSISHFIWEVEELGSTIRKADREALKAFITRPRVTERAPYGRYEISKPQTCSYIGTLNDESGFLTDPTGNRRFRACAITSIDWKYSKEIDVEGLWAQAVALRRGGETWMLTKDEINLVDEANQRFEVEDFLSYEISTFFEIDSQQTDWYMSTPQVILGLRNNSVYLNGSDQQLMQRIGVILTKRKLEKVQKTLGTGERSRVWIGIRLRGYIP